MTTTIALRSGTGWRSTTEPGTGYDWTAVDYANHHWRPALAPYPVPFADGMLAPNRVIEGTAAAFMWDWDQVSSVPDPEPDRAYFRHKFVLNAAGGETIAATAIIAVDDDFDLYVNGQHILRDANGSLLYDGAGIPLTYQVDFGSALRHGENVIAIAGRDFRGLEWVLFDAEVEVGGAPDGNRIVGTFQRDVLFAGPRNDVIHGDAGDDDIFGGGGDDLISGGSGRNRIDGGSGSDTVTYAGTVDGLKSGVTVDLDLGHAYGTDAAGNRVFEDKLVYIENVIGSSSSGSGTGHDVIYGDENDNRLEGLSGNDRLYGRGGDDHLVGGSGDDLLSGGAGRNHIDGGTGNDTVTYAGTVDGLKSGVTVDLAAGRAYGRDAVGNLVFEDELVSIENVIGTSASEGGTGDDVIYGNGAANRLQGRSGNDRLYGRGGNDHLDGRSGNDHLDGGPGNDTLIGGAGNDTLVGGPGDDLLYGGPGTDTAVFPGRRAGYALTHEGTTLIVRDIDRSDGDDGTDRLRDVEFLRFADGTVPVPPPNRPPVAVADSYTLLEDHILGVAAPGILANDSDPDDDPLTAALVDGPSHGALAFRADGGFTYTPNRDYHGTDIFTYRASDGKALSNPVAVTIEVTPVNDPPVAVPDSYTVTGGQTLTVAAPGILANDSDVDGDPLTAVLSTGPAHGSLVLNADGSFHYTPNARFVGEDNFTYRPNDGFEAGNAGAVSIQVLPDDQTTLLEAKDNFIDLFQIDLRPDKSAFTDYIVRNFDPIAGDRLSLIGSVLSPFSQARELTFDDFDIDNNLILNADDINPNLTEIGIRWEDGNLILKVGMKNLIFEQTDYLTNDALDMPSAHISYGAIDPNDGQALRGLGVNYAITATPEIGSSSYVLLNVEKPNDFEEFPEIYVGPVMIDDPSMNIPDSLKRKAVPAEEIGGFARPEFGTPHLYLLPKGDSHSVADRNKWISVGPAEIEPTGARYIFSHDFYERYGLLNLMISHAPDIYRESSISDQQSHLLGLWKAFKVIVEYGPAVVTGYQIVKTAFAQDPEIPGQAVRDDILVLGYDNLDYGDIDPTNNDWADMTGLKEIVNPTIVPPKQGSVQGVPGGDNPNAIRYYFEGRESDRVQSDWFIYKATFDDGTRLLEDFGVVRVQIYPIPSTPTKGGGPESSIVVNNSSDENGSLAWSEVLLIDDGDIIGFNEENLDNDMAGRGRENGPGFEKDYSISQIEIFDSTSLLGGGPDSVASEN